MGGTKFVIFVFCVFINQQLISSHVINHPRVTSKIHGLSESPESGIEISPPTDLRPIQKRHTIDPILPVVLPSNYNLDGTKEEAEELQAALNVQVLLKSLMDAYKSFEKITEKIHRQPLIAPVGTPSPHKLNQALYKQVMSLLKQVVDEESNLEISEVIWNKPAIVKRPGPVTEKNEIENMRRALFGDAEIDSVFNDDHDEVNTPAPLIWNHDDTLKPKDEIRNYDEDDVQPPIDMDDVNHDDVHSVTSKSHMDDVNHDDVHSVTSKSHMDDVNHDDVHSVTSKSHMDDVNHDDVQSVTSKSHMDDVNHDDVLSVTSKSHMDDVKNYDDDDSVTSKPHMDDVREDITKKYHLDEISNDHDDVVTSKPHMDDVKEYHFDEIVKDKSYDDDDTVTSKPHMDDVRDHHFDEFVRETSYDDDHQHHLKENLKDKNYDDDDTVTSKPHMDDVRDHHFDEFVRETSYDDDHQNHLKEILKDKNYDNDDIVTSKPHMDDVRDHHFDEFVRETSYDDDHQHHLKEILKDKNYDDDDTVTSKPHMDDVKDYHFDEFVRETSYDDDHHHHRVESRRNMDVVQEYITKKYDIIKDTIFDDSVTSKHHMDDFHQEITEKYNDENLGNKNYDDDDSVESKPHMDDVREDTTKKYHLDENQDKNYDENDSVTPNKHHHDDNISLEKTHDDFEATIKSIFDTKIENNDDEITSEKIHDDHDDETVILHKPLPDDEISLEKNDDHDDFEATMKSIFEGKITHNDEDTHHDDISPSNDDVKNYDEDDSVVKKNLNDAHDDVTPDSKMHDEDSTEVHVPDEFDSIVKKVQAQAVSADDVPEVRDEDLTKIEKILNEANDEITMRSLPKSELKADSLTIFDEDEVTVKPSHDDITKNDDENKHDMVDVLGDDISSRIITQIMDTSGILQEPISISPTEHDETVSTSEIQPGRRNAPLNSIINQISNELKMNEKENIKPETQEAVLTASKNLLEDLAHKHKHGEKCDHDGDLPHRSSKWLVLLLTNKDTSQLQFDSRGLPINQTDILSWGVLPIDRVKIEDYSKQSS